MRYQYRSASRAVSFSKGFHLNTGPQKIVPLSHAAPVLYKKPAFTMTADEPEFAPDYFTLEDFICEDPDDYDDYDYDLE